MSAAARSTGVAITNPLVLYRALVATKRIDPDPAQHRLAIHLQKLYDRLKDYEPIIEYNQRLTQISRALGSTPAHPIPQHAATTRPKSGGVLASLFEQKGEKESMALTRVLTSHEEVIQMDSPQGLMLHGEVGTGKSMLIDLFADCLPNRKKKRWHFTTFMLEVLSKLEYLRRSRQTIIPSSLGEQDDYSLLWLAREMISTSPILFLDEFQLPDRAASKIMTNLMTCFFHLGGVLIATSNRMPEELAKAAGMELNAAPPPSKMDTVRWRLGLKATASTKGSGIYGGTSDFSKFLDVLRARCEVWQMEGGQDYRRREAEQSAHEPVGEESEHVLKTQGFEGLEEMSAGNVGLGYEQSRTVQLEQDQESIASKSTASVLPKQFLLKPSTTSSTEDHTTFTTSLQTAEELAFPDMLGQPLPWTPSHIIVYNRRVPIPRQHNGVAAFTFTELCITSLGPADYITLASTYHTLILTDVPILTLLHKNEARRFITLLDALYEARCKLLITAEAGPDELFFPEQARASANGEGEETVSQDATLAETISDVYQDATAPFRPNISSYDPGASAPAEPDFTHARLAGILSQDQLEDGPPNTPRRKGSDGAGRGDSIYGLDTAEDQSLDSLRQRLAQQRSGPNFQDAGIFTGEDEKFAYKRARSRLWEMCGKRWWERSGEWWNPLEKGVRRWERQIDMSAGRVVEDFNGAIERSAGEGLKSEVPLDERDDKVIYNWGKNVDPAVRKPSVGSNTTSSSSPTSAPQTPSSGSGSTSPFRVSNEPPPKIPWTHMWGFMKWGKKAGAWGKGVEGLEEREVERKRRKEEPLIITPDDETTERKA